MVKLRFEMAFSLIVALTLFAGCGKDNSQLATQAKTDPQAAAAPAVPATPADVDKSKAPPVTDKTPAPTVAAVPVTPPVVVERKPPPVALSCRFADVGIDTKKGAAQKCVVSGQACWHSQLKDSHKEENKDDKTVCRDQLTVACNGRDIFTGEATQYTLNGSDYLMGNGGTDNLVVLMYSTMHNNTSVPSSVQSYLKVGNHQLEGACETDLVFN